MTEAPPGPAEPPGAPPPRRLRLGRLVAALRGRDWLGIAIEVAIVALGVLIAFQVDQWGERRQQAIEERRFLERLYTEYQRGIAELNLVDRDNRRIRQEIRTALAARGDDARLRALSRLPDFGCGAARLRSADYNDTGFEEMVASGRINLISDQSLRAEVRDLAAAQATSARQVVYARELMLRQLPYLNPYYRFDIDARGSERCSMDWPELVEDQQAFNAAVRASRVHGFVMDERQRVRVRSQRLIGHLACVLGKAECPQAR